ncbi:MAG: hypothetical protein AB1724_14880 [Thermodesulfobacteriota bacterium]
MISVKKKPFLQTYKFFTENKYLGSLKVSLFKPSASFSGREGDFGFFREKHFEGKYFLSSQAYSFLASAHKPNGAGLKYIVEFKQHKYDLKPGELFYDRLYMHYELYKDNELIGTLVRDTASLKYLVDFKIDMPNIVQVFIFWLSLNAWIGERGWMLACYC